MNISGFDLAEADLAQLKAVADAGGGVFTEASSPNELRRMATESARKTRNIRQIVDQRAAAASAPAIREGVGRLIKPPLNSSLGHTVHPRRLPPLTGGESLEVQIALRNLFDKQYYVSSHLHVSRWITPGQGRNLQVSGAYRF